MRRNVLCRRFIRSDVYALLFKQRGKLHDVNSHDRQNDGQARLNQIAGQTYQRACPGAVKQPFCKRKYIPAINKPHDAITRPAQQRFEL